MVEAKKKKILSSKENLFQASQKVGYKEGAPIEKGVVLNEEYLENNYENLGEICSIFTAYPDVFLDIITPEGSGINLFFYQRIFLRAVMRFQRVNVTACRAWSKSFLTILGLFLQCVFIPRRKVFICAPNKTQGAQIGKEKLAEIFNLWPLLRKEVVGGDISDMPGNYGKDYITLKFRNGSVFDLVGALESTLGGRRHGGLIDEIKNHDETTINTIVLPWDVKEGALIREDYRTDGERKKKRCRIYAANGERKQPNPVPSLKQRKVQRLISRMDFITIRSAVH